MQKKIDFLNRLFKLAYSDSELLLFLTEEKLISDFERSCLKDEADIPKFFANLLEKLKREDRLLLLDYEWQVLPVERLKLTLVTERNSREFVFNY